MLLFRYHNSVAAPMPDRLRSIMLASGTTTVETAIALETLPELRPFSWYAGAYQQYHTAFLLLMEVYVNPQRKEADRIWACLDYVFETNAAEPRRSKGKKILSELQAKTAVYQSMRGMRAPIVMEKHIGRKEPRIAGSNISTTNNLIKEETSAMSRSDIGSPGESEWSVANSPVLNGPGDLQVKSVPGLKRIPLIPEVQFAGVSNGESLWALPSSQSPEASSDTMSLSGGQPVVAPIIPATDDLMADIDWVRILYIE